MKHNLTSQSLLRCLFICLSTLPFLSGIAQEKLDLQTMTSNVFRTNSFKAINVGKNGYLWAGTQNSGLYKYNGTVWQEFKALANNAINDIKTDYAGGTWVAQSGSNGAQAFAGGIGYFPDTSFNYTFYTTFDGLPTRYVKSLYINNSIASLSGRIWSAHLANITGGISSTGCIARGLLYPQPLFHKITTGVDVSDNLGSVQAIGGSSGEVWAFALNNFKHSQILRYNFSDGTFIGYYDDTNTNSSLPAGFIVRSIYFDSKNRVWMGMSNGGVYIYDGGYFHQVIIPSILTATTTVNANAITGDSHGNIYIGTFTGLVVFSGSDYTDASSFVLYTTANGLPSNNIQAIAIDTITNNAYNRILATDNGIVRWKPTQKFIYYKIKEGSASVRSDLTYNSLTDKLKIATDGSTSTLIRVNIADANQCTLRFKENSATDYTSDYGQLIFYKSNKDSLFYFFHHPTNPNISPGNFNRLMHLEVYNNTTKQVVLEDSIGFVRPPVLLIHGVWSSIQSLSSMESYLISSHEYKDYQVKRIWFPNDIHVEPRFSAWTFQYIIPYGGIDVLLKQCTENGLSAGKVDIAAHSRGGLFARYYLQSSFTPYRNDVSSLITINTPHWGSQAANLILDKRPLAFGKNLGQLMQKFFLATQDDSAGAYELKINNDTLVRILNGAGNTPKNQVPVHAIVSTYKFGISKVDVLKTGLLIGSDDNLIAGSAVLGLRLYLLTLGTNCLDASVDNCLREIFNEDNDIVVPLSSQKGGLSDDYITTVEDAAHSKKQILTGLLVNTPAVMDVLATHQAVSQLFNEDPNNSKDFKIGGFRPPTSSEKLNYTFLPGLSGTKDDLLGNSPKQGNNSSFIMDNVSSVKINDSLKGKTFYFRDTAKIPVSGSSDIKNILVSYTGSSLSESYSDVDSVTSKEFNFIIPKEAAGTILITAYGFDDNGFAAIDSSYINIGIPDSVKLDSIRIQRDEVNYLEVAARDSIGLQVLGYYSDTVRNITYLPGIDYAFSNGGIASVSSPAYLKGIVPNESDQLRISYLGQADSIQVNVTDSLPSPQNTDILPLHLLSFTGYMNSGKSVLNWTSENEYNFHYYEIQRSIDGINFTAIGTTVTAGNSSLRAYQYVDGNLPSGAPHFYYRLKMVDKDGSFIYSSTVIVKNDKPDIHSIIFPNPVRNTLYVQLNGYTGNISFCVYDYIGRKVNEQKLAADGALSFTVNTKAFPAGVYLIKIDSKDKKEKISFIKE